MIEIEFRERTGEIVSKSGRIVYGAFFLIRADKLRRRIVIDWCFANNVVPKIKNDLFWFYDEGAAMAFKLRWM